MIVAIRQFFTNACSEVRRFVSNPSIAFKVSLAALLMALLFIVRDDVRCETYIVLVLLTTVTLWSCFSFRKNIAFFLYYAWVLVISEVCLYVQKGFCLPFWVATVMLLVIGYLLLSVGWCLYRVKEKEYLNEDGGFENLFPERKQDLVRLTRYVADFRVIGINSFWGNGKTCLYEMFKKQNEESYYFISISVMTLKLDSVERFLVSEISRILEQNKIYSAASAKLSTFLYGDAFRGVGRFFTANSSYTEAFQTLMLDINKLDRHLFITFEDIDRVSDVKIAHKVFAISEMLTRWTNRIRILFQYDRLTLAKKFEGEHESYIEKYIPYTIDLTPISFSRCLKVILTDGHNRGDFETINEKDFYIITQDANIGSWFSMAGVDGIGAVASLALKWYSIRSIELFIKEVDTLVTEDVSYDKKVVVLFQFIKHFMPGAFNINLSEGIYDNTIFSFKGTNYNIQQILAKLRGIDDIESRRKVYSEIFPSDSVNLFYLVLMNKLGYKLLKIQDLPKSSNSRDGLSEKLNEKASSLRDKDDNEKLDRLIRRMYAMGRSDRTDLENAVLELEKVLDLNGSQRESEFQKFLNKAYYQDFERVDNATIFLLGVPQFLPIFRSFLLYERSSDYWLKLIDLYFSHCNVTGITAAVIQCLNYCRTDCRDVFFDVVRRFNGLEIKGNLKKTKAYPIFLKKYIKEIINLTGIPVYGFELLFATGEAESEIIDEFEVIAKDIKSQLRNIQKEVVLDVIKDDCAMLCCFLDKNHQLLQSSTILKEYEDIFTVHTEIHNPIWDVEEKIKNYNLKGSELEVFLEDSYRKGNLKAIEVQRLLEKFGASPDEGVVE